MTDCKLDSVVHVGVCGCGRGEWTCLVWPEWPTPDSFCVPSHRLLLNQSLAVYCAIPQLCSWRRPSQLLNGAYNPDTPYKVPRVINVPQPDRWAEMNHSDHYTNSEQASRLPNSLMPSTKHTKLRSTNLLGFTSLVWPWWLGQGSNPGLRPPELMLLATMLRWRSFGA